MTRWPAPRERLHGHRQERFDPVAEGARHGLAPELSVAIWQRVSADADGGARGEDVEQARRRFHDIAARIAAGRLPMAPCIGKRTRAAADGDPGDFTTEWLESAKVLVPGRRTRVESRPDRHATEWQSAKVPVPGRRTMVDTEARRWRRVEGAPPAAIPADAAALQRLVASEGHQADPLLQLARGTGRHAVTLYRRATGTASIDQSDPAVEAALRQRGAGQPLPEDLRSEMERTLGISLTGVRIHTDGVAAQAARALGAEAFTVGNDIFFASGKFAPHTPAGRKLLVHELTHVAQALRREPAAAGRDALRVSHPGESHEQEAEAAAERAELPGAEPTAPADGEQTGEPGARAAGRQRDRLEGQPAETERSLPHRVQPEAPDQRSEGPAEGNEPGSRMPSGLEGEPRAVGAVRLARMFGRPGAGSGLDRNDASTVDGAGGGIADAARADAAAADTLAAAERQLAAAARTGRADRAVLAGAAAATAAGLAGAAGGAARRAGEGPTGAAARGCAVAGGADAARTGTSGAELWVPPPPVRTERGSRSRPAIAPWKTASSTCRPRAAEKSPRQNARSCPGGVLPWRATVTDEPAGGTSCDKRSIGSASLVRCSSYRRRHQWLPCAVPTAHRYTDSHA